MWRKNIIRSKRDYYAKQLQEKLFILDDKLGSILVEHRKNCVEMEKQRIIDLSGRLEVMHLEQFASSQRERRDRVAHQIETYSNESRRKFKEGIREILSDLKTKFNDDADAPDAQPAFRPATGKPHREEEHAKTRAETVYEALGFSGQLDYK